MRKFKNIVFAAALVLALGLLSACSFESKVNYVYKNGEEYTAGDREITEKIEKIDIHYLSGDVKLLASETGVVTIKETSEKALDEKLKVHTWVDGTTLYVRYCASAKGLSLNNLKKQLVITIPSDEALGDLKVDVSSADFTCDVSVSDQVKINTTSGDVNATVAAKKILLRGSSSDITLNQTGDSEEIKLETSSGNITVQMEKAAKLSTSVSSGKTNVSAKYAKEFKAVSTSGDCSFAFETAPAVTDVHGSSSDVTISVPKTSGITADLKVSSGKLYYDLPFSKNGDAYVSGDGANQMKVVTSSGDINITVLE